MGRAKQLVADNFAYLLGSKRGSGPEIIISRQRTEAGEREFNSLLEILQRGEDHTIRRLLMKNSDLVEERPYLKDLKQALSAYLATSIETKEREVILTFFDEVNLLPKEALCIVEADNKLHLFPEGEKWPCAEEELEKITAACGQEIKLLDREIPRAKLGEWLQRREDHCSKCQDYRRVHSQDFRVCLLPEDYHPLTADFQATFIMHLQREIQNEIMAFQKTSEEICRSAFQKTLVWQATQMFHRQPYGERAVLRTLGRRKYQELLGDLEDRRVEAKISELISEEQYAQTLANIFRYQDPDQAKEFYTMELAMFCSMATQGF